MWPSHTQYGGRPTSVASLGPSNRSMAGRFDCYANEQRSWEILVSSSLSGGRTGHGSWALPHCREGADNQHRPKFSLQLRGRLIGLAVARRWYLLHSKALSCGGGWTRLDAASCRATPLPPSLLCFRLVPSHQDRLRSVSLARVFCLIHR